MARICEICAKKPLTGKQVARRGISKKAGGIGLKTTGITTRRFLPNLQSIRALVNGGVRVVRVCTKCIKAGKVVKAPVRRHTAAATA